MNQTEKFMENRYLMIYLMKISEPEIIILNQYLKKFEKSKRYFTIHA